ncbi:hypothetical protein DSECCO2_634800 [anaerobic digester metagenome]
MDVGPVARPGFGLRELVEEAPDGPHPSGPLRSGGVDVEPGLPDLQAEPERPERPLLADDLFERPHLLGAGAFHVSRLVNVPVVFNIQRLHHQSHQVSTNLHRWMSHALKKVPGISLPLPDGTIGGFTYFRAYV